jgi:hypothetical protein
VSQRIFANLRFSRRPAKRRRMATDGSADRGPQRALFNMRQNVAFNRVDLSPAARFLTEGAERAFRSNGIVRAIRNRARSKKLKRILIAKVCELLRNSL